MARFMASYKLSVVYHRPGNVHRLTLAAKTLNVLWESPVFDITAFIEESEDP